MNDYEAKRAAKIERLRERAAARAYEAGAAHARARAMAEVIPLGQPILVGHYSEGRDRRYRARVEGTYRKSFELANEAEELRRLAAAVEDNEAISSDDPDAVDKLRAKLELLEHRQAIIVAVNKRLRAGESFADVAPALDWWQDPLRRLEILGSMGHNTIPPTNGGAEIRRVKARIAELEQKAATPPPAPVTAPGARIEQSDNRVRIVFDAKPSDELRARLKSAGFRWAPSAGAWQRHASTGAWYAAKRVLGLLDAPPAPPAPPALPEDHDRYFTPAPGAIVRPVAVLKPTHARPEGIANAEELMAKAYRGEGERRAPITVRAIGDGAFEIVDGNSTFAVACRHRWSSIPTVLV